MSFIFILHTKMRNVWTVVRGIRTPVIKQWDDLANIVIESLMKAEQSENFTFNDHDIVAITEAVVWISSWNYATVDQIAKDIQNKFQTKHIWVLFPILSRNRFAVLLSAMARAMDKITLQISFPSDEVGNDIMDKEQLKESWINPYTDIITEEIYHEKFGDWKHIFTWVNMVDFYKELIEQENCEAEIILANDPKAILNYVQDVLVCDIHTRFETKETLKSASSWKIMWIDEIMTNSVDWSWYNSRYWLLWSNRATEEKVKLFPENWQELVDKVQAKLKELTGKTIEVMIYWDWAFKDPIWKIWELADPVVSPAYTSWLEWSPNELKLKYLSDSKFAHLQWDELSYAIKTEIKQKESNLKWKIETQWTTPRKYTDLIWSLCDLTSWSGDKWTPVVFIQWYFDNYSHE